MYALDTELTQKATTQYWNYPFNSFCRFLGRDLAASPEGLFLLEGETDDGAKIESKIVLNDTDMGLDNPKRARFAYFGYEADGDLEVSFSADEKWPQTKTIGSQKTGQQRRRVSVPHNIFGRYWSVSVANVAGCDFSLDSIEILPILRSQGHNEY